MALTVTTAVSSRQNQEAIDLAKERYRSGTPIDFGEFLTVLDHNSLTLADRREIAILYDMDAKDILSISRKFVSNETLRSQLGTVPETEYDFVDALLKQWQTRMTFQGMFTIDTPYDLGAGFVVNKSQLETLSERDRIKVIYSDPKTFALKEMLMKLIMCNRRFKLPFTERQIENAISVWMNRVKDDIASDLMTSVAWESPVLTEMMEEQWLALANSITEVRVPETVTVLKHFVWQIKRKMFGYTVEDHMMPIFYGPQGAGKSTLVKKYICGVVADFFANTNFQDITEGKNHDIWRNYVLFFDEMGRSATSNIEDIKRRITEDTFNSRILSKNVDTQIVNRATFVGTTNKDVSRLIFDDTGMRRFYQIDCKPVMDWAVFDRVNFIGLWRSVNERQPSPLQLNRAVLADIKRTQAIKRQITTMEAWLRSRPYELFREERVRAQALFEEYVEYEKSTSGNQRCDMNVQKFGRDIKDIAANIPGLELTKRRDMAGFEYRITYSRDIRTEETE
jgi:hypothetical protein